IVSFIAAQQAKFDLELVPKEKRIEIGKYVPEVYMHQFWDSVYKHDTFYRFKMDKRKIFKLTFPEMKETKAYKTYLGFASGATPPSSISIEGLTEEGSDSKHETNENESNSKSDQEENEEEIGDDKEEEEDEFVRTPSNDSNDETNNSDKPEGDEDEEMDYIANIPHRDAKIVSLMDVHVHHDVPSKQTPTLLTVHISVITEYSPIYSTVIPQSIPSFGPPPPQSTPTPPPTTEAINPPSILPDFALVFQFNNKVTTLKKEVAELKKDDPLKTQVIVLVDEHMDAKLGSTRDEFMNFLLAMVTESLDHAILAKESSQPQSSYEAAASITKFELKRTLIKKWIKTLFSTYDKVYSLKKSQKDKDKDEDPSAGSDRGLKKRKTSKDAELAKGPKAKESQSGSYKGEKSQSKYSRKSVQSEEPEFEVADSDMP
nr:hypothetical protein [Tanacetum cinerariifolium]